MSLKFLIVVVFSCHLVRAATDHDPGDIWDVVSDILGRLEEKESRISELERLVSAQQKKIVELEQEVAEQSQWIQEVRGQPLEDEDTSSDPGQLPTGEENDSKDPDVTSRSTVRKENRIRQVPESPVAFLASLSEHAKNLGVNQTMIFDHATTNIGNAYNEHAGVFIAPVSGIYLFSTTIFIFPNINAHYELRRNGVLVTRMYLHGTESVYETASTTAVLQLSAGDDVTVVNVEGNKAVYGSHYSSFTGVFLQEFLDEELSVVG